MSVSPENISRIYLFLDIIKDGVIAVGDDGLRLLLEGIKVIHDQ